MNWANRAILAVAAAALGGACERSTANRAPCDDDYHDYTYFAWVKCIWLEFIMTLSVCVFMLIYDAKEKENEIC